MEPGVHSVLINQSMGAGSIHSTVVIVVVDCVRGCALVSDSEVQERIRN